MAGQTTTNNHAHAAGELARRIRVLEERYAVLRHKSQLADHSLIRTQDHIQKTLSRLSSEIMQVRRLLIDIDDKLDRFLEQVKKAAPREDVLILKKYLEMWDPIKYLTREEAKRLLEERKA